MPCQELVELVTAYLDGSLSAEDRERLDAHLKLCDPCVEYIEQFRETIALTVPSTPPTSRPRPRTTC